MAAPEGFVSIGLVGFTDKGEYDPDSVYVMNDIVHWHHSLWRCLMDNTAGIEPKENKNWTIFIQSPGELDGITATDSKGVLGTEGKKVSAQELADRLAAPKFEDFSEEGTPVPEARTAISQILSGIPIPRILFNVKAALMGLVTIGEMREYLVNNGLCTEAGKYFMDAAYGKTLKDEIDSINSNLNNRKQAFTIKSQDEKYIMSLFQNVDGYGYIDIARNSSTDGKTKRLQWNALNTSGNPEFVEIENKTGESSTKRLITNADANKLLWSGRWSSGDITVPDFDKYTLFRVTMEGQGTDIIVTRHTTFFRGIGGYMNPNGDRIYLYALSATVSGNVLTYSHCALLDLSKEFAPEERIVTGIYGLC